MHLKEIIEDKGYHVDCRGYEEMTVFLHGKYVLQLSRITRRDSWRDYKGRVVNRHNLDKFLRS